MSIVPGDIRNILAFNSGVEEVVRMDTQGPSLPIGGTIDPNPSTVRPSLHRLLFSPSIGEELERSFQPRLESASILVPTRYKALLTSSHQALRAAFQGTRDGPARGQWQGEEPNPIKGSAVIRQAIRFLADLEGEHRELDARRSATTRG